MTTEFRSKSVTVMFADVVESVRLIEQDEARNVARIAGLLDLLAYTLAPRFDADVLERRGDGLLMTFADSRQGAACAHAFHMAAAEQALHGAEEALMLRVGLHTADVLADGRTIYGRGANLAARITALAKPGETLSSSETRSMLTDEVDACISDLGECFVKNRIEPVRVYRLDTLGASDRAPGPAQLAPPDDPRVSLAVLPFADHAALSRSDDLNVGDVATEQFTQAMSRSPQVRVISRLSANAFRGRLGDLPGIAEKLGVHYVVRGSVDRTSERRVRLTLELVQMRTRSVIWQGSAEGPESEAGQADSDLIGGPIAELSETLIGVELRAARVMPLPNLATHTLMLAAIAMMHRFSRAEFDRSRQLLELLVDRVPRHPGPMAWLARWHVFRVVQKWSGNSQQDASRAMSLADRALDLDPMSSIALTVAGSACMGVRQDARAATAYYERALAVNPNESLAWLLKSVANGFSGHAQAALDDSRTAIDLTPLDPMRFYYDSLSASAALGACQYAMTVSRAQRAIRANSLHGSAYRALAIAQSMLGHSDLARDTIDRLLVIEPTSTVAQFRGRAAVDSELNRTHARALAQAGLPLGA